MKPSIKIAILALSILLGWAGWRSLNALFNAAPQSATQAAKGEKDMAKKVVKSDQEWKKALNSEQYRVMIQCGTERPFSGKYNDFWEKGTYFCAACGTPLFTSETKYEHGTGWPSFMSPINEANLEYRDDFSLMMRRTEVRCAACGAHLGHVFDDGPGPSRKHYCINSAALDFKPETAAKSAAKQKTETAIFAAGCFWGVEYKFSRVKGVLASAAGYSGGVTKNPTYRDVCTDKTGHAESVEVTYDPARVSYEDLVRKFFDFHDPTQLNRQGPDVGTQYRSVIFYNDEGQKRTAEKVKAEYEKSGAFKKSIVTEIVPAGEFYKAEEYHQKYYEKNKIKSCAF
ncbi:MAG: bifunctional methionine sulfoxide reductase B/A protein [Candidatus Aminicenantes bacterium]|nr:bifunctional methionine sulfoxide reductase B/A protein [Candidatus Aminicenantes bacterium]